MDWNCVSKTLNKSWYIHIVPIEAKSSPKTKFEKVFLWNSLVSVLKHGDESSGRLKMRLKERFLGLKLSWIDFLYTLGEFSDKTQ